MECLSRHCSFKSPTHLPANPRDIQNSRKLRNQHFWLDTLGVTRFHRVKIPHQAQATSSRACISPNRRGPDGVPRAYPDALHPPSTAGGKEGSHTILRPRGPRQLLAALRQPARHQPQACSGCRRDQPFIATGPRSSGVTPPEPASQPQAGGG